jgi:hypothetical protein
MSVRRLCRACLVLVLAGAALAGCDRYASDIDAVKRARATPDLSNEELVKEIAGARGSIEWKAGPAEAYDGDDIIGVTATVTRPTRSGDKRLIVLEFIHNRQTEKVALDRLMVDGRPQNLVSGFLNLLLMQLE